MAKVDAAKEEIGWLKVVFAVFVVIDASLVAWLCQTYGTAHKLLLVAAGAAAPAIGVFLLRINLKAYRRIRELESLS